MTLCDVSAAPPHPGGVRREAHSDVSKTTRQDTKVVLAQSNVCFVVRYVHMSKHTNMHYAQRRKRHPINTILPEIDCWKCLFNDLT